VNRSTQRILTTHVGSLPRSSWEVPLNEAVTEVVERQRMTGIDVINEGEYTKGGDWLSFADNRLSGFRDAEQPPGPPKSSPTSIVLPPHVELFSLNTASRSKKYAVT